MNRVVIITGSTRGIGLKTAEEFLKTEDEGRKSYLKNYFGKNIDDPLLYDLVINTDLISYEEAAHMIGRAVILRHPRRGGAHPAMQQAIEDWSY